MRPMPILVPVAVVLLLLGLVALPSSFAQPVVGTTSHYLPLVFRAAESPPLESPTATVTLLPTRTPQPTVTATPVPFSLVNGDFEQGKTGWDFLNGAVVTSAPGIARAGIWSARLGGGNQAEATLRQQLRIPIDTPYLSFWYTVASEQTSCYEDLLFIRVKTNPDDTSLGSVVGTLYEFCHGKAHADYQQKVLDVRAYAGQIVYLDITLSTNAGDASYAGIDDVSFISQP